jgi:hypothetical protein
MAETALHAALKTWYARPGDEIEVRFEGYIIDVKRDQTLIEIQTRSFSSIKAKLLDLVPRHPVRLVYPIAKERWIVKVKADRATVLSRRKSPKRGKLLHVFNELIRFPSLLAEPNLTLELLLIQEEEVRHHEPNRRSRRSWSRRGWMTHERRLLEVLSAHRFERPADLLRLLPPSVLAHDAAPFTTSDLAAALKERKPLAQKTAYCLRESGVLQVVGKRGNAFLYRPTNRSYPFHTQGS